VELVSNKNVAPVSRRLHKFAIFCGLLEGCVGPRHAWLAGGNLNAPCNADLFFHGNHLGFVVFAAWVQKNMNEKWRFFADGLFLHDEVYSLVFVVPNLVPLEGDCCPKVHRLLRLLLLAANRFVHRIHGETFAKLVCSLNVERWGSGHVGNVDRLGAYLFSSLLIDSKQSVPCNQSFPRALQFKQDLGFGTVGSSVWTVVDHIFDSRQAKLSVFE